MSITAEIQSYDTATLFERTIGRGIHLKDKAEGVDRLIERHLENVENVINILIQRTKEFKYVGFGDFVRVRDQNLIVDTLKLLDNVLQVYYPCPSYSQVVSKIRYVTKKDTILPEDHNLVIDAIKSARDCIASVVPKWDIISLDMYLGMLKYVKGGDPVLSFQYNAKIDALKQLLKFIFKYVLVTIEHLVEVLTKYDLSTDVLEAELGPLTEFSTTTEFLELLIEAVTSYDLTMASLDLLSVIEGLGEATTKTIDSLDIIEGIGEVTTAITEGLAEIQGIGEVTIEVVEGLAPIEAPYDFPEVIEGLLDVTASYDFPPIVTEQLQVLTEYDFPSYITEQLQPQTEYDHTIESVEMELHPVALAEIVYPIIVEKSVEILSEHHESIETVDKELEITVPFDLPPTISGYMELLLSFDFPSYITEQLQTQTEYDFPPIYDLIISPTTTYDFPSVYDLEQLISAIEELTTATYDLTVQALLEIYTTLESYDLEAITQLLIDKTLESYDLETVTQLILNKYIESLDLEVLGAETVIEKTLESYDKPLNLELTVDRTTQSLDETPTIQTSYEFEIVYWLAGFNYRRAITITNNAQEVSDYQVLIVLTPQNFDYSKAKPDGSDIRFTKDDGITKLPYWIEIWNPSGESWIWVKIDHLPLGDTVIYMYYGNPQAESEENPEQVFPFFDHFDKNTLDVKWKFMKGQGAVMDRVIQQ